MTASMVTSLALLLLLRSHSREQSISERNRPKYFYYYYTTGGNRRFILEWGELQEIMTLNLNLILFRFDRVSDDRRAVFSKGGLGRMHSKADSI
jgi:hypothetical protein